MTFEKQVKEAKEKQLTNRIMRDAVFIILGIVFLIISVLMAYSDKQDAANKKDNTTTTTIKEKENK